MSAFSVWQVLRSLPWRVFSLPGASLFGYRYYLHLLELILDKHSVSVRRDGGTVWAKFPFGRKQVRPTCGSSPSFYTLGEEKKTSPLFLTRQPFCLGVTSSLWTLLLQSYQSLLNFQILLSDRLSLKGYLLSLNIFLLDFGDQHDATEWKSKVRQFRSDPATRLP